MRLGWGRQRRDIGKLRVPPSYLRAEAAITSVFGGCLGLQSAEKDPTRYLIKPHRPRPATEYGLIIVVHDLPIARNMAETNIVIIGGTSVSPVATPRADACPRLPYPFLHAPPPFGLFSSASSISP